MSLSEFKRLKLMGKPTSMGKRIYILRRKFKMSQWVLAEKCGVIEELYYYRNGLNQRSISNYELDLRIPHPKIIKRLAKALKTTVEYLLHGEE